MTTFSEPLSNTGVKILVLTADSRLSQLLRRLLDLLGYRAETVDSGEQALSELETNLYDLMVLDLDVHDMLGIDILTKSRDRQPSLLLVVMTGGPSLESAIAAIKVQAADFLLKPVTVRQIISSIAQALEKRAIRRERLIQDVINALDEIIVAENPPAESPALRTNLNSSTLRVDMLRLDRRNNLVTYADDSGRAVKLSKGESVVLASLMARPGETVSCQEIVRHSWGQSLDRLEASRVVRPFISRLRRKLEQNPSKPAMIRTVRRQGYMFAQ